MSSSRIASIAALLGGLAWIATAVKDWGGTSDEGPIYLVGMVALGVALAAAGYTTVTTAPGWLRIVLMLATPSLGFMVWITLEQSLDGADYLPIAAAGVLMVLGGSIGLTRAAAGGRKREPVSRGRRAAR